MEKFKLIYNMEPGFQEIFAALCIMLDTGGDMESRFDYAQKNIEIDRLFNCTIASENCLMVAARKGLLGYTKKIVKRLNGGVENYTQVKQLIEPFANILGEFNPVGIDESPDKGGQQSLAQEGDPLKKKGTGFDMGLLQKEMKKQETIKKEGEKGKEVKQGLNADKNSKKIPNSKTKKLKDASQKLIVDSISEKQKMDYLNKPSKQNLNTAMHLCCLLINKQEEQQREFVKQEKVQNLDHSKKYNTTQKKYKNDFIPDYYNVGKYLLDEGASWTTFNYRGWNPPDYFLENLQACQKLLNLIDEKEDASTYKLIKEIKDGRRQAQRKGKKGPRDALVHPSKDKIGSKSNKGNNYKEDFEVEEDQVKASIKTRNTKEQIPEPKSDDEDERGIDFDEQILNNFNFKYQYCIITKANDSDPRSSIIYKQLKNIMTKHNKEYDFEIKVAAFKGLDKSSGKQFIYLIYVPEIILLDYSSLLNFNIYNQIGGFHDRFRKEFQYEYEPLRDYYVHRIIYYMLNLEFDMQYYKDEEILIDHFPLHEFQKKKKIMDYCRNEVKCIFTNFLSLELSLSEMRPFNAIAMYHGVKIGLYFGFFVHYTSWLILPSILGTIVYLLQYILPSYYGIAINFYSFFIGLWVLHLIRKWKQKESKLAYLWSMHEFEETEEVRKGYAGDYTIDPVSKEIIKSNSISTFSRRLIMEAPVLGLAVLMISFAFGLLLFANNQIKLLQLNGSYSWMALLVIAQLPGIVNTIVIKIFNWIYEKLTSFVVKVENHKHETTRESSLVLKNFIFQFVNTYIFLFYFSVFDPQYTIVVSTVISAFCSNSILNLLLSRVLPILFYKYYKRNMSSIWKKYMETLKLFKQIDESDLQSVEEDEDLEDFQNTQGMLPPLPHQKRKNEQISGGDLEYWGAYGHEEGEDEEESYSEEDLDETILQLKETLTNTAKQIYEGQPSKAKISAFKKTLYLQQSIELTKLMGVQPEFRLSYTYLVNQHIQKYLYFLGFLIFYRLFTTDSSSSLLVFSRWGRFSALFSTQWTSGSLF